MILCDTNIIIDFYKGDPTIVSNLKSIGQENIAVSIITVGELLFGVLNKKELNQIRSDLDQLKVIHLNEAIGEMFIQMMSKYVLSHRLSLPDGLIAATALTEGIPLFTRNQRDFKYIRGLELFVK